MRKIADNEISGYGGSHTVFRHSYESYPAIAHAQFAVRRVFIGEPREETQMETKLERAGKTRTTQQSMSICMTPVEAREFAFAIAPELKEALALLERLAGFASHYAAQSAMDAGGSLLVSDARTLIEKVRGSQT